uniref:Uncharacterized protein n=1 Tax=Oryza punctata TaxID=4537 RepID=A0A0E0MIQ0_ORYPU
MRFLGWYLKITAGGAAIGAAMELFMIHTGFYEKRKELGKPAQRLKP